MLVGEGGLTVQVTDRERLGISRSGVAISSGEQGLQKDFHCPGWSVSQGDGHTVHVYAASATS